MEEKISALIENFNTEELKYELGRQEIKDLSIPELRNLLDSLPIHEDGVLLTRIITKKYIFMRINEDLFACNPNQSLSFFKEYKKESHKSREFRHEDLENILYSTKPKKSLIRRVREILHFIYNKSWFIFPILSIIIFISLIIQEINKPSINLVFITFLLWIIIFCIYSLSYGIFKTIKIWRNPQKIKIEYSLPFLNLVESINISESIIAFGQFFIFLISTYLIGDLDLIVIILLIILSISFGILLFSEVMLYYIFKKNKWIYTQQLKNLVNNKLQGNDRLYYFQIVKIFEDQPIIVSEKIPSFYTIFSILITFTPIIAYILLS